MPRLRIFLLAGIALAALAPQAHSQGPAPAAMSGATDIPIDGVWTGTRVTFAAVTDGPIAFLGYYNAQRQLTLARLDTRSGAIQRTVLPVQFAGWDSHNSVVLAFDRDKILHVAANMHNSPLTLFRAGAPLSIDGMQQQTPHAPGDQKASYPTFISAPGGDFYVLYRSGGSGKGDWIVLKQAGAGWSTVASGPIFGDHDGHQAVNAYPSDFVAGPDGFFNVAMVWRANPNVESNYRLSFARTKDFAHWQDSAGRPLPLPLTPDHIEVVDDAPQRSGLLNNVRLSIGADGQPVILYSRYDEQGRNAVFAARRDTAGKWAIEELAQAQVRKTVAGVGTVSFVNFGGLALHGHAATIPVSLPGEPPQVLDVDANSLHPTGHHAPPPAPHVAEPMAASLAAPQLSVLPVGDLGHLVWTTQSSNHDEPRACTPDQPHACTPPAATLHFVKN